MAWFRCGGVDRYQEGYNAGVSATKKGNAGTGDVLFGKTFTNASSVGATGTMPNYAGQTRDATPTQDATYTYLPIPANGYYNTSSKLRTANSNLQTNIKIDFNPQTLINQKLNIVSAPYDGVAYGYVHSGNYDDGSIGFTNIGDASLARVIYLVGNKQGFVIFKKGASFRCDGSLDRTWGLIYFA